VGNLERLLNKVKSLYVYLLLSDQITIFYLFMKFIGNIYVDNVFELDNIIMECGFKKLIQLMDSISDKILILQRCLAVSNLCRKEPSRYIIR
jgi:hypothetical protein